jgi:uncharacterized OB-fold protein
MMTPPTAAQATPTPENTPQDKATIARWRCPNCGQMYFCDAQEAPPDICHYCRDMTTWERLAEA